MNYTITPNAAYNSLEISFDGKPAEAVRDAMKALKFRWHAAKKVWYGYADEETARAAIEGKTAESKNAGKKPAKINLDGLENNKKTTYGADFAAVLRADLKARGVKGVTIRAGRGGWTDSITATITLTAEDFRSAEEAAARDGWRTFFRRQEYGVTVGGVYYHAAGENAIDSGSSYTDNGLESNFPILRSFWREQIAALNSVNHYHLEPSNYPELTTAAFERVDAIVKIIQSYNWDNSDSQSDYFDVGFYLDIDIKKPADFTPREFMTDAEREQLEKDLVAEAAEAQRRAEEWERQQEEARAESIRRAEQEARDVAEIAESVTVENLPEGYYIDNLLGGIGKESTLGELKERADRPENAFITRRVTFSNAGALRKFENMLLCDFEFLAGMGGTGTNDPRVTLENMDRLNSEQRERVKFYSTNCVAVYFDGVLQMVVNPEGYNYARYCYLPNAQTVEESPEDSTARTISEENAQLEPFYFPAPVEEQAAALPVGEVVTVYETNGFCWVQSLCGLLESVEAGKYAQYSGVYLTIRKGRKSARVFCRNGKETLVFRGLPLVLPDSVIYESVTTTGTGSTMKQYRQYAAQLREIVKYYAENDRRPILDTIQR